jgi:hypothetical protein
MDGLVIYLRECCSVILHSSGLEANRKNHGMKMLLAFRMNIIRKCSYKQPQGLWPWGCFHQPCIKFILNFIPVSLKSALHPERPILCPMLRGQAPVITRTPRVAGSPCRRRGKKFNPAGGYGCCRRRACFAIARTGITQHGCGGYTPYRPRIPPGCRPAPRAARALLVPGIQ